MQDIRFWGEYTSKLQKGTSTDQDLLKRISRGIVLDVGCGIGIHLAKLNEAIQRIGVDVGLLGLIKGKQLFPQISFICATGCRLPLKNNTVDSIICIDVIEHVDQPLILLQEIQRVLKPGGRLFLQTPNYPIKRLYDVWHWLRGSREEIGDDPTHVTKLNVFSLKKYMQHANLKIEKIKARNLPFQNIFPKFRNFLNKKLLLPLAQKIILIAIKENNNRIESNNEIELIP